MEKIFNKKIDDLNNEYEISQKKLKEYFKLQKTLETYKEKIE